MKEKSDSRSHNMSHVKGKDTSIELKVRKYLFVTDLDIERMIENFLDVLI